MECFWGEIIIVLVASLGHVCFAYTTVAHLMYISLCRAAGSIYEIFDTNCAIALRCVTVRLVPR